MSTYSEPDLVIPALEFLAAQPGGLTTKDLRERLTDLLEPDGADTEILRNRGDTKFSQRVRNLTSHRTLVRKGYATYDRPTGIHRITPAGRSHVDATAGARQ